MERFVRDTRGSIGVSWLSQVGEVVRSMFALLGGQNSPERSARQQQLLGLCPVRVTVEPVMRRTSTGRFSRR